MTETMKTFLLIAGIVILSACAVSFLFAVLNLYGYYNVLDGSTELYNRLRNRSVVFAVTGIVLAVIGAVCLIIRAEI